MAGQSAGEDIAQVVRGFILTSYLPGETADNLPYDLPLQSSGILDSLAMLGVITFIEQRFGVELGVEDTLAERFDRIRDIAATVAKKKAATVPDSV